MFMPCMSMSICRGWGMKGRLVGGTNDALACSVREVEDYRGAQWLSGWSWELRRL